MSSWGWPFGLSPTFRSTSHSATIARSLGITPDLETKNMFASNVAKNTMASAPQRLCAREHILPIIASVRNIKWHSRPNRLQIRKMFNLLPVSTLFIGQLLHPLAVHGKLLRRKEHSFRRRIFLPWHQKKTLPLCFLLLKMIRSHWLGNQFLIRSPLRCPRVFRTGPTLLSQMEVLRTSLRKSSLSFGVLTFKKIFKFAICSCSSKDMYQHNG